MPGVAGKALHLDGASYVQLNRAEDLRSDANFTWTAWIRTTQGGTILARSGAGRDWQPGGKVMFIQNGRLRFDVGWVGATGAEAPVADANGTTSRWPSRLGPTAITSNVSWMHACPAVAN